MFWKNICNTALVVRTLKHSQCLPQIRNQSNKNGKAERIKKLRREDNLFFGKLMETNKQRKKRIKLEAKGKIPKSRPPTVDSELEWVKNSSIRLKVMNLSTIHNFFQEKASNRILHRKEHVIIPNQAKPVKIKINSNCNTKNKVINDVNIENVYESSKIKQDPMKEEVSEFKLIRVKNIVPVDKTVKPTPKKSFEQLLYHPLFDESKSLKDVWTKESDILRISVLENPAFLKLPSVTKILTTSMSEEAKLTLEKWKLRMTEQLGARGFALYQQELFSEGKLLHSIIFSNLMKEPFEVSKKIEKSFHSLKDVLKDVESVRALESHVIHEQLSYRGVLDCVAVYRGELCVIDWKKSDKPKDSIGLTYDAPLQVASYIGALNSDSKYPFQINKGLIVVAYTNGEPAQVHEISGALLQLYWQDWLKRLKKYYQSLNSPEEKKGKTS